MKRFILLTIIVSFATAIVYWLIPPSAAARHLVADLAKTKLVALGPIDDAPTISRTEEMFFTLLSSHHSAQLFRELFDQGTNEAKFYALAGLRVTNPRAYAECAAGFTQGCPPQNLLQCFPREDHVTQRYPHVSTTSGLCWTTEALHILEHSSVEEYILKKCGRHP